jgi:hypothetical protein
MRSAMNTEAEGLTIGMVGDGIVVKGIHLDNDTFRVVVWRTFVTVERLRTNALGEAYWSEPGDGYYAVKNCVKDLCFRLLAERCLKLETRT